jgi:hypothetical protein
MCHYSKASFDGKYSSFVPNIFLCFQCFVPGGSCAFEVTHRLSTNLQVWGLFAPKYVFDVIGLLLMDLLICLASLYYS